MKKQRVEVVADKRTIGAAPGKTAHPLKEHLPAWLAKGWKLTPKKAPAEPEGETPEG